MRFESRKCVKMRLQPRRPGELTELPRPPIAGFSKREEYERKEGKKKKRKEGGKGKEERKGWCTTTITFSMFAVSVLHLAQLLKIHISQGSVATPIKRWRDL